MTEVLDFLSPDKASHEAVWRSPLERALREAPPEVSDVPDHVPLDVRDGAHGRERVQVEIGEPAHERLTAHLQAGEHGAQVDDEEALGQLRPDLGRLREVAEDEAALGREMEDLERPGLEGTDVPADVELPCQRNV